DFPERSPMPDTVRPKRRFPSKRSAAAALLLLGILGGGVAAYAYFTGSSGSGSSTGTVGSSTQWSVGSVSSSGTMYPGGGSVTLSYTVTNGGSGYQKVTSAAVSVATDGAPPASAVVLDSSDNPVPGCLASWFAVNDTTTHAAYVELAPSGSETGSATVTMTDA